ncbi:MAG: TonB-dependent receptor [Alphaproteobacteria bacterium]|nr:TonB-dependent receptor [Alphaproteobacteria bacterium]MBM3654724.1 TonB-dependent receptor [Alphaproteobacteria bacterium]
MIGTSPITLPLNFHLLAGFRYDSARNTTSLMGVYPSYSSTYNSTGADAVKPRVGLLWQPIPQLSVYGNYVEGFGFSNGISVNQTPLPPESARQYEGGVKVALLDDRLTATFAYFDIIKKNIRSPAPASGSGALSLSEVTGAVRNRGIEVDVQGQVFPELKIIGSYASIDSRIISDIAGGGVKGNRWWGVPRNSGSLWAVYEPQFEQLKGLAVGAGFVARGSVEVDRANSFTLPGYATVDMMARYSFEYLQNKVSLQLNVGNLLDKTYYFTSGTVGAFGGFIPGAPRNFKGSIKVDF